MRSWFVAVSLLSLTSLNASAINITGAPPDVGWAKPPIAGHADDSDHATQADKATQADQATNAGHANMADFATTAGSSGSCTSCTTPDPAAPTTPTTPTAVVLPTCRTYTTPTIYVDYPVGYAQFGPGCESCTVSLKICTADGWITTATGG